MAKRDFETKWRGRLRRWRRSGTSVAAFCRKEGVSKATFYAWRRRLGDGAGDEPAVEFVEVTPMAAPGTTSIELEVDGVVVRLGSAFDADDLQRVLGVLQGRWR